MEMGAAPMGSKNKKLEIEINDIHTNMVKSSLVLRDRIREIQNELKDWKSGLLDEDNGENPSMH
jgi:hypothetical protein